MLLTRWTSSDGFLVYFSNGEGKKSPNIYERLLGKIFHKKVMLCLRFCGIFLSITPP